MLMRKTLLYLNACLLIMQERNGVKEVDFEEATEMLKGHGVKLIWLGSEPLDYIANLLELDTSKAIQVHPRSLIEGNNEDIDSLKGSIFACYHGNTSGVVVKALKARFGIDSYSLKGGVTAVVGEIF